MTLGRLTSACVFLGLLPLAVVSPCLAQMPQAPGVLQPLHVPAKEQQPYGQRTDAFRRLLFELRFQPLHRFGELHVNPREALLVVLGDPSCLSKEHFPKGLREFVEQGGAVLLATDYETNGEPGEILDKLAGVRVTGETLVRPPQNPPDPPLYDDSEYCPFVQPVVDSGSWKGPGNVLGLLAAVVGAGSRPALFRDPHAEKQDTLRVATNAPSRLKVNGLWLRRGISRLAELPAGCLEERLSREIARSRRQPNRMPRGRGGFPHSIRLTPEEIEKRLEAANAEKPLFAVGGEVGKGRVLILADHSIFINRMILPRDNGNLEFAANCLHWLRGGVSTPLEALKAANNNPASLQQLAGPRDKLLFWDDGTIRSDFKVPLKTKPMKPSLASEPAIVAAVDKTLARLEDNDFYNRQILDGIDSLPGGFPRVLRSAVYLLTLAAFLFLGYRFLWRSRYRPEATVPMLAETVGGQEPTLSVLDQRRRALLHSGNVWEIAHRLAREYFESANVPLTQTAPRVEMKDGSLRQRWRLNRRVARLWKLARGDAPIFISPAALQRWLRELEEVKTALRDGMIRLT